MKRRKKAQRSLAAKAHWAALDEESKVRRYRQHAANYMRLYPFVAVWPERGLAEFLGFVEA